MKNKEHPYYATWSNMKARCFNQKHPQFRDYGGRGITVCDEWKHDFWQFVADMGDRPDKYTLERVDNDLGYCPENCIWDTRSNQALNQRPRKVMSKSGVKGVVRKRDKWAAQPYCKASRKEVYIGVFDTIEEAAAAIEQHRMGR